MKPSERIKQISDELYSHTFMEWEDRLATDIKAIIHYLDEEKEKNDS